MPDMPEMEIANKQMNAQLCDEANERAALRPVRFLARNSGIESAEEIYELTEDLRMISYKTDRLAIAVARSCKDDKVPEKRKALYKKHLEILLEYKKVLSERITDVLEISNEENENIKKAIEEITESK